MILEQALLLLHLWGSWKLETDTKVYNLVPYCDIWKQRENTKKLQRF